MPVHPSVVALVERVRQLVPEIDDPAGAIQAGWVTVDGVPCLNSRARIRRQAAVRVRPSGGGPRGSAKLGFALGHFSVPVSGRVCLDVGASTGGFTTALLDAGAKRVYAVDAGYGQLLGSLRIDPRVVNLERTNVADLHPALVPEPIGIVTVDLSYLRLADAAPQLSSVEIDADADLVALVKPMYELHTAAPPCDEVARARAVAQAAAAFERSGWHRARSARSPVGGRRGAVEHFLHLHRRP